MVILPLLYPDLYQQMGISAPRSAFVPAKDPAGCGFSQCHTALYQICCCMPEAQDMLALVQDTLQAFVRL